jgi:UDP:flavonoid glycosyltransferase YjiC (YdhE family)
MERWLFVTAASADIGFGHVSRTHLLAHESHRLGVQVDVITSPGSVPGDVLESGPRWHEVDVAAGVIQEVAAAGPPPSVVVMDAPDDWLGRSSWSQAWAADQNPPLVAAFRSDGPPKPEDAFEHVSLTPTFEAPRTTDVHGPAGPSRRWRGRDLIFVRPNLFLQDPTTKDDPPRIVVTMGGADPHKITWQVCHALLADPVPARVAVVIGRLNPDAAAIAAAFAAHFEVLHQGAFDFDDLLKRASIAVVNAGLTRYECIAAQTPFVAISMNERQASFTELVVDEGFGAHAGVVGPAALTETLRTLHDWLSHPTTLDEMRRLGRTMVDPTNASRFVRRLAAWERERRGQTQEDRVIPSRKAEHR